LSKISYHLDNFQKQLASVCKNCNSDASKIFLIAVTKNHSATEINKLLESGISKIGENRLQEALEKFPDLKKCEKHFIGRIQSNKAHSIAQNFDVIHSVASLKIAQILDNEAQKLNKIIPIFLQANISRENQKSGFLLEELNEAVKTIRKFSYLKIQGLMVMGVFENMERTREIFAMAKRLNDDFGFVNISMGMSGDWKIAIEEGATHLRIGSLLFRN
jgi:PLP dependent protein